MLSGGWRKRLAIARELAAAPDILLMDEPTNHLDVAGILWLEDVLSERARAFVVVSHDRYFLEHVDTRMLELNRVYPAGLLESEGSYRRGAPPTGRFPGIPRHRRAPGDRMAAPGRQGALHQGQGAHQGGGPPHRGA